MHTRCDLWYTNKNLYRDGKEEWVPFDSTPYCSPSSYDAASPLFHKVIAALQSLNITVEQVQKNLMLWLLLIFVRGICHLKWSLGNLFDIQSFIICFPRHYKGYASLNHHGNLNCYEEKTDRVSFHFGHDIASKCCHLQYFYCTISHD